MDQYIKALAHNVAAWLKSLNKANVKPCVVSIEGSIYSGAYYLDSEGEEHVYLVGAPPKHKRANVCYPCQGKEWHIACHLDHSTFDGLKDEQKPFHPFGANFIISPWEVPDGTKIDEYERFQYLRIPMQLNCDI